VARKKREVTDNEVYRNTADNELTPDTQAGMPLSSGQEEQGFVVDLGGGGASVVQKGRAITGKQGHRKNAVRGPRGVEREKIGRGGLRTH